MILTSQQIRARNIVTGALDKGYRHTTYDATVGEILSKGQPFEGDKFRLPPRGMVWVVSRELFAIPTNVTGLATLRTSWTHDGVLTLNVGVVDPGWNGPLAAAIVNFSEQDFFVKKGDAFLRVAFHEHDATGANIQTRDRDDYIAYISGKSKQTSDTFLNLSSLASEIIDRVFTIPRWVTRFASGALIVSVFGVIVALIAIFVPIAVGIIFDFQSMKAEVRELRSASDKAQAQAAEASKSLEKVARDIEIQAGELRGLVSRQKASQPTNQSTLPTNQSTTQPGAQ